MRALANLIIAVAVLAGAACGDGTTPAAGNAGARAQESPSPEAGEEHEISLYHCGIEPTTFQGRDWRADPVPFDATNRPEEFAGHGEMRLVSEDEAEFVDDSGERIRFVPVEEDWSQPLCK